MKTKTLLLAACAAVLIPGVSAHADTLTSDALASGNMVIHLPAVGGPTAATQTNMASTTAPSPAPVPGAPVSPGGAGLPGTGVAPTPGVMPAPSPAPSAPATAAPAQVTPAVSEATVPDMDLPGNMKFCATTPDARERLGCFENLSRKLNIVVQPAHGTYGEAKAAENHFEWSTDTRKLRDGSMASFAVIQTDKVTSSDSVMGSDAARAVFRCSGGQMAFYLNFKHPLPEGSIPVEISDGTQSRAFAWETGSSHTSIGLWDPSNAISMSRYLMNSDKVQFTLTLPAGRTIGAAFDFSGMKSAIGDVRSGCGW